MADILLIEPDRLLARSYLKRLLADGHQVRHCLTGQAGIQAADQRTPDLIVLEFQLKGHNGVEFLYELRSYPEWQAVPVVVQSVVPASAFEGIGTWPLLGVAAYLYKPQTSLAVFADTVQEVLAAAHV